MNSIVIFLCSETFVWAFVCLLLSCCRFGAVFLWDSGSSVGEVSGHCKLINSVDIRQKRPYRLATASDDTCGSFFEGPPFKFKFTLRVSCRNPLLRFLSPEDIYEAFGQETLCLNKWSKDSFAGAVRANCRLQLSLCCTKILALRKVFL